MGPFVEELNGFGLGQRRDRELPLAGDVQRLSARHEQAQLGARAQKGGHVWGSRDHLLEVVERKEDPALADMLREVSLSTEPACDGRHDELRVADPDERHPQDSVLELADQFRREIERETSLARPSGSGQRQETYVLPADQFQGRRELALAPDQPGRRQREVRPVEAAKRRKLILAQLVQAKRRGEVLQAVIAEVATSLSMRSRVAWETTIWAPCVTAQILAATTTSSPT